MENKIQISIANLEILLQQYKAKVIQNITENIGSYEVIQELRKDSEWHKKELKLKEDIERIAQKTELPNEVIVLKKYLL